MRLGIVAVGYDREKVLERLLLRLNECYFGEEVLLIISLDYSGKKSIEDMAVRFQWLHGSKEIVSFPKRLGLRNHIFTCGSYMQKYELDAIAVFEDDTYPSVGFYSYMKQAVTFYAQDDRIAGISLYTHLRNVHVDAPFQPQATCFDVFFLQLAQSWGQIWMKKQWGDFVEWYQNNGDSFSDLEYIPENVCKWSSTSSWLKYHIRYCIETNKFFVYPYESLSTCFSEIGEHTDCKRTYCQVPLQTCKDMEYRFPVLESINAVHYDAFFENLDLEKIFENGEVCIDLYGYKPNWKRQRYWLTTRQLDFKIIQSFGLELKPHEMNCFCRIPGDDIYLYDTKEEGKHKKKRGRSFTNWEYFYRKVSPLNISIRNEVREIKTKIINKCHLFNGR